MRHDDRGTLARFGWITLLAACSSGCSRAPLVEYSAVETARPLEPAPTVRPAQDAPNVVLVLVDALRRDRLGIYGCTSPTSPFLDSLAETGVTFDNAQAQAPQTHRSTTTLVTSRYFPLLVDNRQFEPIPGQKRSKADKQSTIPRLAAENVTLAEVLQAAGYRTFAALTNPHHHPTSGFSQGFDSAPYLFPVGGRRGYAEGSAVNREFLSWLGSVDDSRPFFAYLHYMDVHNPYVPPARYRDMFVTASGEDKYKSGIPQGDEVPTAEDLLYMQQLYDAEIRYVDDLIREVLDACRRRSTRQTLFVLASDHGDEFMDHGGLGHGRTLEREMLHMPLILHGLGRGSEGKRVPRLVRNLDIAPTILELTGTPVPESFEGVSLTVALSDPDPRAESDLARLAAADFSFAKGAGGHALTTRRWHAIFMEGEVRLYDNLEDPLGTVDVAPQHPGVIAALETLLGELVARGAEARRLSEALSTSAADRELDPAIRDQLDALGYTGDPDGE